MDRPDASAASPESAMGGAEPAGGAFAPNGPVPAFDAPNTETGISEHKGFAALLNGRFMAVRNPHAHTPKIHWEGEDNAADYFTLISMLYRKVDGCRRTA